MTVERRKSQRKVIDEECIIFIRGSSIKARLYDVSGVGVSFIVDDKHIFEEAMINEDWISFQNQTYSGVVKVVRVDTFNSLGKAVIGCERRC